MIATARQDRRSPRATSTLLSRAREGTKQTHVLARSKKLKHARVGHDRNQPQAMRQNLVMDDGRVHEHIHVLDRHRRYLDSVYVSHLLRRVVSSVGQCVNVVLYDMTCSSVDACSLLLWLQTTTAIRPNLRDLFLGGQVHRESRRRYFGV